MLFTHKIIDQAIVNHECNRVIAHGAVKNFTPQPFYMTPYSQSRRGLVVLSACSRRALGVLSRARYLRYRALKSGCSRTGLSWP